MLDESDKISMPYSWAEMKDRSRNAVLLAAASMFGALPMFQYQFRYLTDTIFIRQPSPDRVYYLAVSQAFILFSLALVCSLIGFLYSERLKLPGFGTLNDIRKWLPIGLMAGLLLTPVRYFVLDRKILATTPQIFPESFPWAVSHMIGTSLPQEVIVRFGLLTIGIYLMRKMKLKGYPWPALIVVSIFGASGTFVSLTKFNLAQKFPPSYILILLIMTLLIQWLYCEVYIRKGLIAAICIHSGFPIKYVVYAMFR